MLFPDEQIKFKTSNERNKFEKTTQIPEIPQNINAKRKADDLFDCPVIDKYQRIDDEAGCFKKKYQKL